MQFNCEKVGEQLKIAVMDGQGGGIGKAIIDKLVKAFGEQIEIIALGTNPIATSGMIKAGAGSGATGEKSITTLVHSVEVIMGPVAILIKDSMMGEISPGMAASIASSSAVKILIPLNRCNIIIPGTKALKLNELIDLSILEIQQMISG